MVLAIIEGICGSRFYLILLGTFCIINIIVQQIMTKRLSFESEDTLDGAKKKLKVKRRYMALEDKDYCYIDNIDLIPGDIIYLTKDDEVPCVFEPVLAFRSASILVSSSSDLPSKLSLSSWFCGTGDSL